VVGVERAGGMSVTDPERVSAAREAVQGCMPLCECGAQAMEPLGRGQAAAKGIIETRVTTANKQAVPHKTCRVGSADDGLNDRIGDTRRPHSLALIPLPFPCALPRHPRLGRPEGRWGV
jgi:hypothetical protein